MNFLSKISACNTPGLALGQTWQFLKNNKREIKVVAIDLKFSFLTIAILQSIFDNKDKSSSKKPEETTTSAWKHFKNHKLEILSRSILAFPKTFALEVSSKYISFLISAASKHFFSPASKHFFSPASKHFFSPFINSYLNFIEKYKNSDEYTGIMGINVLKRLINNREYEAGVAAVGMIVRDQVISHLVEKILPPSSRFSTNLAIAVSACAASFIMNAYTDTNTRGID